MINDLWKEKDVWTAVYEIFLVLQNLNEREIMETVIGIGFE